jgi:RND family efflux transporter MFP subunit
MIAAAVLAGCQPTAAPPPAMAPTVVTVSQPLERKVTDFVNFTGRTAAVESVEVRARVSGYIEEVSFQPGQEVKAGQALFKIDPTIYRAAVAKAQADVNLYDAQVKLAVSELERSRRLFTNQAIAREDYEKAQATQQQAIASLAAAKAALTTAQQNLAWTTVSSPIAGKTGVNLLTKGNLVVADQTLLTTVVSQDPMYVYFDVDEATVLRVQKLIREGKATSYQKAAYPIDVGLANEAGYPHHGIIDFVSNQLNRATGTLSVRGQLPNPDRVMTTGLFARVRLPIGRPHPAVLVTDRALGSDQGQRYLLLVDDKNEVGRRDVEIGGLHDGALREITSGVQPTDWVVVEGLLRVRPGITVEPHRRPMPVVNVGTEGAEAAPAGNATNATNATKQ